MPISQTCWLVINLDRSPDRLEWMRTQFGTLGISFERVAAVDGLTLDMRQPGLDAELFRRCFGRELRPADAGCYLSHLRAIEQFLQRPHEYAVILEDDATLSADVVAVVARLTAPDAPKDWDMVKLSGNSTLRTIGLRRIVGSFRLANAFTRLPGAAAYLVNRRAAKRYLEALLPMEVLYDHAFDRGWSLGLRTRVVAPLPASGIESSHSGRSSIETVSGPRVKVKWWRKAPTLWWRTRNEVARFLYAVVAKLQSWSAATLCRPGAGEVSRRGWLQSRVPVALALLPALTACAYLSILRLEGNFHPVVAGELYRSAQPAPRDIAAYADAYGIRTIINLRGRNAGQAWYDLEIAEARRRNIDHVDFSLSARRQITMAQVADLMALLRHSRKPILIHCRDGADRTGLAAAFYLASIAGRGEEEAEGQLSFRYGHVALPFLPVYAMDRSFEALEGWLGFDKSRT